MLTMPNSAQADTDEMAICSTTGAWGQVVADWWGADDRIDFKMTYGDTLADGHHMRVRLVTTDVNGTRKNWSWHSDTDGANNGNKTYASYATNSSGIFGWGIQVGRFEGDSMLNSCTDWAGS